MHFLFRFESSTTYYHRQVIKYSYHPLVCSFEGKMDSSNDKEVCQCEFDKTTKILQDFVQNVSEGKNEKLKSRLRNILQYLIDLLPSKSKKRRLLFQEPQNSSVSLKLPNEIWMKIISYLENKDIFARCGN